MYRNDPDYAGIIEKFEYKNGVYFSVRPQACPDTCPNASSESCPSRMKQFNYRNGFYIDYDDSAVEGNRFKILYKSIRAVTVAISESETDYWLDLGTILAAPNGDSDMGSNELSPNPILMYNGGG